MFVRRQGATSVSAAEPVSSHIHRIHNLCHPEKHLSNSADAPSLKLSDRQTLAHCLEARGKDAVEARGCGSGRMQSRQEVADEVEEEGRQEVACCQGSGRGKDLLVDKRRRVGKDLSMRQGCGESKKLCTCPLCGWGMGCGGTIPFS